MFAEFAYQMVAFNVVERALSGEQTAVRSALCIVCARLLYIGATRVKPPSVRGSKGIVVAVLFAKTLKKQTTVLRVSLSVYCWKCFVSKGISIHCGRRCVL